MSGITQGLLASLGGRSCQITVGTNADLYGYDGVGATYGSISPDPFTIPGATIEGLNAAPTGAFVEYDFRVETTSGGHAQSLFRGVTVQDGTGVFRTYYSADATYDSAQGRWSWGTGSNPVYQAGDTGEVRSIWIF